MKVLTADKLGVVMEYLKSDLHNCLYLYGDIEVYGINNPNVKVWYSEKSGKINAVIMKYFTGAHIFSKELDYDLDEIVEHINIMDADRISGQKPIIEVLEPLFSNRYNTEYGCVFELKSYRKMKLPDIIKEATVEDADKIADLMMSDEMCATTYTREALAQEFKSRLGSGLGRSYVIRDGDRIVGHDSISLETSTYAIAGMMLVHEDYRKTLYGAFIDSYIVNELGLEGKKLYCMIVEGRRMDNFVRLGNPVLAHYGKLFKKALNV